MDSGHGDWDTTDEKDKNVVDGSWKADLIRPCVLVVGLLVALLVAS